MRHFVRIGLARFGLAGAVCLLAAQAFGDDREPISAPPPPPPLNSGEPLEPQVTIRRTDREVIYEYRRNGQLYMVRVQPRVGPPYYFIDVDNDGMLDFQPGEPIVNNINQWTLYRW